MLTSVGHGALGRNALVKLLREAGIEALVDIRRFPNSRHNPDVETSAIAAWSADAGLVYRWEPRLGGRRTLPAGTQPEETWWRVRQFAAYAAYTRTSCTMADSSPTRPRTAPDWPMAASSGRRDGGGGRESNPPATGPAAQRF